MLELSEVIFYINTLQRFAPLSITFTISDKKIRCNSIILILVPLYFNIFFKLFLKISIYHWF